MSRYEDKKKKLVYKRDYIVSDKREIVVFYHPLNYYFNRTKYGKFFFCVCVGKLLI